MHPTIFAVLLLQHFRRENADGAELGLDVAQLVLSKL